MIILITKKDLFNLLKTNFIWTQVQVLLKCVCVCVWMCTCIVMCVCTHACMHICVCVCKSHFWKSSLSVEAILKIYGSAHVWVTNHDSQNGWKMYLVHCSVHWCHFLCVTISIPILKFIPLHTLLILSYVKWLSTLFLFCLNFLFKFFLYRHIFFIMIPLECKIQTSLPWYNQTGWLGVKHQFTYLLTPNKYIKGTLISYDNTKCANFGVGPFSPFSSDKTTVKQWKCTLIVMSY